MSPVNRAENRGISRDPAVSAKKVWRNGCEIVADMVVKIRRAAVGQAKVAELPIQLLKWQFCVSENERGVGIRVGMTESVRPIFRANGNAE